MAKKTGKRNTKKLGPKKRTEEVKIEVTIPSGAMTHTQVISRETELTTAQIAECGSELATEELQLDQVRKEKKEKMKE